MNTTLEDVLAFIASASPSDLNDMADEMQEHGYEFECLECGCQIPEQRRALGGVTLCIDCQTVVEIHNKQYR